ncbi:MAG: hypothetical protein JXQ83_07335 [Candidatus Glassbacteria bacterium]|nr:hypothetical protein [Candidatus Glassbacteria bacterium]
MAADYPFPGSGFGPLLKKSGKERALFLSGGSNKPQKIRYQVISDFKDIRACLQLRYVTYRYVNFVEENEDRLDVDAYDRYSDFLGAFNVTGGKRTLVGALRVISGYELSNTASHVEKIIRDARNPGIRALKERPELFPLMESFELPASSLKPCGNPGSGKASAPPYEISRLVIRPDYWLHGIEVGLHYLLILESMLHNPARKDFLIAVHPRSKKRYEKLGLKVIPGTGQVLYKYINQLAIAMVVDMKTLLGKPPGYGETCESLLPGFRKHGFFIRTVKARDSYNSSNSSNP